MRKAPGEEVLPFSWLQKESYLHLCGQTFFNELPFVIKCGKIILDL